MAYFHAVESRSSRQSWKSTSANVGRMRSQAVSKSVRA